MDRSEPSRETARRLGEVWARALDREDFDAAALMLGADCEYSSSRGVLTGPRAIVASYRSSAVWAHETFDRIEWLSAVEAESGESVVVTFTDVTTHRGLVHRYRCRQRLSIDDRGLISAIEHLPIEAEERALAEFFARVGVERP